MSSNRMFAFIWKTSKVSHLSLFCIQDATIQTSRNVFVARPRTSVALDTGIGDEGLDNIGTSDMKESLWDVANSPTLKQAVLPC